MNLILKFIKKKYPELYIKLYNKYQLPKIIWYIKNPHPIKYIIYITIVLIILIFFFVPKTGIKAPLSPITIEQGFENPKPASNEKF